ncbi:hypothetical protein MTsPCn9_12890 [Croceitalea sp. MTPC9]|nr:hypothetical protein MTsPCn6_16240 [Croceitalea sp. MTPC6]GMN16353.1 hypothetical protein MTsPCn9_12890 [Croceitalea sp. MTPC9]
MESKSKTKPKNLYLAKNLRMDCKSTAQNNLFQENKASFLAKKTLNTSNSFSNPFQTFVKSLLLSA